ncbi:MAG: AMP-binding protein, partial [Phaeodactylibacter sp.]|nr:AMP-binding protein [Phaeodactylibacter sp.]
MPKLSGLLRQTSEKFPERTAFIEPEQGRITYGALQQLAARLSQLLSDNGVEAGDRVGVCLPKSILSVGAIFGILEAEAAYVPVDVEAPENRNGYILENCQAKALLVSSDQLETYASHFEG